MEYLSEQKNFVLSEQEFKDKLIATFGNKESGEAVWNRLAKPEIYPCVVVKNCGGYIYVYLSDFE